MAATTQIAALMTWRQDLTGQVFDPASLNVFWFELTAGAYGAIQEVAAVVEIVDGSAWALEFIAGSEPIERELSEPRWLNGRPTRPSQIQVTGQDLDTVSLMNTIADCWLPDATIENYQAQLRAQMGQTRGEAKGETL
ncbi:MAG: hypothetical protein RLZZ511_3370 [Cyanobacteriota bacterium]|jgi:hypothetical protein